MRSVRGYVSDADSPCDRLALSRNGPWTRLQAWGVIEIGAAGLSQGGTMTATDVRGLFQEAITGNDAAAMRKGVEQLLGLTEDAGLSAEEEYLVGTPTM